jgi:hypothetical protein
MRSLNPGIDVGCMRLFRMGWDQCRQEDGSRSVWWRDGSWRRISSRLFWSLGSSPARGGCRRGWREEMVDAAVEL